MAFFDLPIDQLRAYRPDRTEPADFDAFWGDTLAQVRQHPLDAQFTRVETGLRLIETYDVTFSGYGGQPIKGWYARPANTPQPLPCVVEYHGYNGGRGYAHTVTFWANAGYAHLSMDSRGQGGGWRRGDTPDLPDAANPSHAGFMTQGVFSPHSYYYRRMYADAVRAIEAACSRDDVDAGRIAVAGGSQGGGLALAAAALMPEQVGLCLADVPFLCHFRRAVGLTNGYPYQEIANFLKVQRDAAAQVFDTLDYFDGVNHAARIRAHCLVSTALMDEICPPSTVFAAYNHLSQAASRAIEVYPWNGHEGGQESHDVRKVAFVHQHWA
jgi:cephalosporin-C deacetylase